MQNLKKYFKLLLVLSMFLSLPLFAKKALMPIVMDDIVVMVSYTIPKPTKPVPYPYKGRVKKTGQTKSYDFSDVVIDGSIKDDGYYQKGITPKYSRANEIVTDHITGLQWQDNVEARTIEGSWEYVKTYCSSLGLDGGGWRLPTVQELQSIVLDGAYNPSIDTTAFVNYASSNGYWSSTTHVHYTSSAWVVGFSNGHTYYRYKANTSYVRCVR